jgi:hypothetical protein
MLVAAAGLGIGQLEGTQRLLLMVAPLLYILGVQFSTFTINVPLNNTLQTLQVDAMGETALKAARLHFEPPLEPVEPQPDAARQPDINPVNGPTLSTLRNVKIASTCSEPWEANANTPSVSVDGVEITILLIV